MSLTGGKQTGQRACMRRIWRLGPHFARRTYLGRSHGRNI